MCSCQFNTIVATVLISPNAVIFLPSSISRENFPMQVFPGLTLHLALVEMKAWKQDWVSVRHVCISIILQSCDESYSMELSFQNDMILIHSYTLVWADLMSLFQDRWIIMGAIVYLYTGEQLPWTHLLSPCRTFYSGEKYSFLSGGHWLVALTI